ncbi:PREDICTED: transcription termination factor 4, mitochondrial-like [Branchiostoma belcheri]|uniref:Transcription termination factor 4, mitochondrial-like n=1 Tax=Branchiostoma belcheri TaxID=7741 RepID=A0A6P4YH90_BRABE|nr:PREDICTED: transcription termination factor 4, mitochondrial-like [Branchiostoma belcheri]
MPSTCKYSGVTHKGTDTQKEDTDIQTTEELVSSILSRIEETQNVPQKTSDLPDSARFWVNRLLEIGCTQKQVYHFVTTNSQLLNIPDEKVKEVFALFLYLDISKNKVMDLLSTYPEILREQPADLKRKVQSLQKHVASVENVAKVVLKCPQVLTLPLSKVRGVVAVLKDNCQFKSAQVQTILTTTPVVLLASPEHAELLFQYAFFAMGATREDMVRAFLFRHTWEHIRSRHMFLERRGMYQPPDKKGKTKDPNPPLRDILATTTKDFLTQVAFASYEEYATFEALLEQEEETDADTSDMSSSDESETEEDTDEDEETTER